MEAEKLAKRFHEIYEKLAPKYMYETRPETSKAWEEVPKNNKDLMIATAERILDELQLESNDRIERMLKWLVVHEKIVFKGKLAGMNYSPEAMAKQINELIGQLPNLSDILEEKK